MNTASGILARFSEELSAVKGAPFAFSVSVLIAIIVLCLLIHWLFTRAIARRDHMIAVYREQLGLLLTPKTKYATLRNKQLKEKTLEVIGELRCFIDEWRKSTRDVVFSSPQQSNFPRDTEGWRTPTREEVTRTFYEFEQKLDSLNGQNLQKYNVAFRRNTIVLRDELASRLPERDLAAVSRFEGNYVNCRYENGKVQYFDHHAWGSFEQCGSVDEVEHITDRLEQLVRMLPNTA